MMVERGAGPPHRGLAITLPFLTFIVHVILGHCALFFASDAIRSPFWPLYNVLAAGASFLGLVGAAKLKHALVSAYAMAHTTTLLLCTLTLMNMILPFDLRGVVPITPSVDFDARGICRDIDNRFGGDEAWLERCTAASATVKLSTAWVGMVLMTAQWWAVWLVWRWNRELREEQGHDRGGERTDVVHCKFLGEKQSYSRV